MSGKGLQIRTEVAGVAQLAEHLHRKQGVAGSNPAAGSRRGLFCPTCNAGSVRVVDTRRTVGGVRRRHECENGHRFTTREVVDAESAGTNLHPDVIAALAERIEAWPT